MSEREAKTEHLKALATVPLFANLSKGQLKNIAAQAAERTYRPGETIVQQGEKGIGFYLLLNGQADVLKGGKKVGALSGGQFFGEMALFDEQPRTAEVRATSEARCFVLNRFEFWGVVGQDATALRALLNETVRRLRAPGSELTE